MIPVGIPQVCGFVVKIPVGIPQVCGFVGRILVGVPQALWLRGQDRFSSWSGSGWDTSSLVASRSRSQLGYLKFCGFGVKYRVMTRMPQVCSFVGRIPVGIHQVMWLRGKHPGWDTSSFAASWSRSRLGYFKFVSSWSGSRLGFLKFCGFAVKIPVGYLKFCGFALKIPMGNLKFVASRSARLGYILQVCGFAVRIPVGILQVLWLRGQDPDWDARSLWLRGLGPGWNTSSFEENPSWDTSRFVASWSRFWLGLWARFRLGCLKFLWLRG